jgi:hypothetical protein
VSGSPCRLLFSSDRREGSLGLVAYQLREPASTRLSRVPRWQAPLQAALAGHADVRHDWNAAQWTLIPMQRCVSYVRF